MASVIHYTNGPGHLPYADQTSDADVAGDIHNLASAVDAAYSTFSRGTKAARPVSSPSQHGIARRIYWAYDTGEMFFDFGTGWELLNQARGAAGGDLSGTFP